MADATVTTSTSTTPAPGTSVTVTTPVVKGYLTSEFWVTVATSLVAILNQAFGWHIPTETIATIAGLAASYVIGRSIVKT